MVIVDLVIELMSSAIYLSLNLAKRKSRFSHTLVWFAINCTNTYKYYLPANSCVISTWKLLPLALPWRLFHVGQTRASASLICHLLRLSGHNVNSWETRRYRSFEQSLRQRISSVPASCDAEQNLHSGGSCKKQGCNKFISLDLSLDCNWYQDVPRENL